MSASDIHAQGVTAALAAKAALRSRQPAKQTAAVMTPAPTRTRRPENAPNSASSSADHETAATRTNISVKIASIGVAVRA